MRKGKDIMFRSSLMMAVCASLLAIGPAAKAQYGGYAGGPGYGGGTGPAPGYGGPGYGGGGHAARCERLRDRLHDVRYRKSMGP